jgi:hypothetical protein
MATSDSEDFESADEDLEINVDNTALQSVKKQTESEVPVVNEYHDNTKSKDVSELTSNDNESGALDEVLKDPSNETDKGACDINKSLKLEGVLSGAESNVNISNEPVTKDRTKDRQQRERVKRQQKPRESKPGGSVRKLGTRISPTVLHACSDGECEKVKQDFHTSEKSEKKTNQIGLHTYNNEEGKPISGSSYRMENYKQELGKLSTEESIQHDVAPVSDKLLQPAPDKVCRIVLDLFTVLVQGCRTSLCVNVM